MNVMELNKVLKTSDINGITNVLTDAMNFTIEDFRIIGLGSVEKNSNKTFFIVVRSDQLQSFRNRFDFDISEDIYCTKLKDTYAEFRVGNLHGVSDYFTISNIANMLRIACKWQSSDDIPYLSNTIILRKLK